MRRALPLSLALAWLASACAPPPMSRSDAIVGGTYEPGEDAVVLVTVLGAVGLCTGTLIAPNVVITAKHCVQAADATEPYPPNVMTVSVGSQLGMTRDYRVRWLDTTPGAYSQNPTTGLTGEIFGIDVGVIVTRNDVEGVTPIEVRRDRPDDMVGQEFTAIGFGRRPGAMAGTKYKTTGTLTSIADNGILYTQMTICSGDSGGPMIQETPTRQIIGVASFGEAGACPSSTDGYNALYNNLDLIDRALVVGGHCPTPSEEVCNGVDDDCDGTVDQGCAGLGEACEQDGDCAYAQRPEYLEPTDTPVVCREGACALPCDPVLPVESCRALDGVGGAVPIEGYLCERGAGCEAFCQPGTVGGAPDGEGCASNADCASGQCTDPGDGQRRCVTGCRAGAGTCPVGEACVGFGETCGACVDASIVNAPRGLGEPCDGDGDCAGGASCLDGACASACDPSTPCPSGYRCDSETHACLRGELGQVGAPCESADECAPGHVCASAGFCTRSCTGDAECPEGTTCGDVDGSARCAPELPTAGEACTDACLHGVCQGGVCTLPCGPERACTAGYACRRDDDGNPRCQRGGCAVRPGSSPGSWPLALGLAALLVAWRRRRDT